MSTNQFDAALRRAQAKLARQEEAIAATRGEIEMFKKAIEEAAKKK